MPERLESEGWWFWLPITWLPHYQPIKRMSMNWSHTLQPCLSHCLLKPFPEILRGVQVLSALLALTPCLVPYSKLYIFLCPNPVSVHWLFCLAGEQTQVWFGNNWIKFTETLYYGGKRQQVKITSLSVVWKYEKCSWNTCATKNHNTKQFQSCFVIVKLETYIP